MKRDDAGSVSIWKYEVYYRVVKLIYILRKAKKEASVITEYHKDRGTCLLGDSNCIEKNLQDIENSLICHLESIK